VMDVPDSGEDYQFILKNRNNENSKPIWNKFIIRKDIIETSQVVLNFCRTVYMQMYKHTSTS
jgi:hypothetical protein